LQKKILYVLGLAAFLTVGIMLWVGHSRVVGTYDDLDKSGEVEKIVHREYRSFFRAVENLGGSAAPSLSDSTLVKRAAKAADRIFAEVKDYPATVQSRLALDALSYAARGLTRSPGFVRPAVQGFWEMSLLNPIIAKGREYMQSGQGNPSTHRQLILALQRGMDNKATTQIFLNVLPVFGPAPSPEVMEIAASDSLTLKRIHDLILYSRSLQKAAPPDWMLTGPWFLALDIPGFFPSFYGLIPVLINKDQYLTFRIYDAGDVYERVFHDPAPANPTNSDAWLNRANTALSPLTINRVFADGVRGSGLPTRDAHYFFNDYFVNTEVDSVRKEFYLIIKRPKVVDDTFHITGMDSITVTFTLPKIAGPDSIFTLLPANRLVGQSLVDGRLVPEKRGNGKAWLMPLGAHSDSILRRLAEEAKPKISVTTQ
jgi:hypothetical protein